MTSRPLQDDGHSNSGSRSHLSSATVVTMRAVQAAGCTIGCASPLGVSRCFAMSTALAWANGATRSMTRWQRSTVCVAVIGPRWANADNLPRLHEERDMVRHELVNALASNEVTLVPTLVEGADSRRLLDLPRRVAAAVRLWNAPPCDRGRLGG